MSKLSYRITRAAVIRKTQGATVSGLEDVGATFRRIDLDTATTGWTPGCKMRVWLGGTTFRTYTPFDWTEGAVSLLVHRHGLGPAGLWIDSLEAGQPVQFLGPQHSLGLDSIRDRPILVGDETSFALAAAWERSGGLEAVNNVFEVTSIVAASAAVEHLGLSAHVLIKRDAGDGHHRVLCMHVLDLVRDYDNAPLILSGKAQTIRAIRGVLKDAGIAPSLRVKAYWDPNRRGLD